MTPFFSYLYFFPSLNSALFCVTTFSPYHSPFLPKAFSPPLQLCHFVSHWDKTDHNRVYWSYSEHLQKVHQYNSALLPCQKNQWDEWPGAAGADSDLKPQGCMCQRVTRHRAGHAGKRGEETCARACSRLCSLPNLDPCFFQETRLMEGLAAAEPLETAGGFELHKARWSSDSALTALQCSQVFYHRRNFKCIHNLTEICRAIHISPFRHSL